jgi:cysteine-rich repeat protein
MGLVGVGRVCGIALAFAGACGDAGGGSGGTGSSSGVASTSGGSTTDASTTTDPTTDPAPTSTGTGDLSTTTVETGETLDMMTDPSTSGVMMTGETGSDDGTTGEPAPACGDGEVDPGEGCDDGPANDDLGACTTACQPAACGDGFMQAGEACDDGNAVDEDACVAGCKLNVCGDGHVGPGEACDDPLDLLCTDACALATCGDGKQQPGEQCDDGNDDDSDLCLSTCLMAACGDGAVQANVEVCDDGDADDTDDCTTLCEPPSCADAIVSGNESDVDCGGACMACEAGAACDAGKDCATKVCKAGTCTLGASCLEIRVSSPMAPSGNYTVDLDGDGPEPQTEVECEMSTDGGGWTLVQRTVWDPAKTAALQTGYADWYTKTIGAPMLGEGYRLAGRLWSGINVKKRHMLVHRVRKAADGSSCAPLYYVGSEGTYAIDNAGATLTGLLATVNMINNTLLSTKDSGPSISCVAQNGGAPWFYSACCSTCPTYQGNYWPQPHPMANYTAVAADQYAAKQADVCNGEPAMVSSGYSGINDMAYYLR